MLLFLAGALVGIMLLLTSPTVFAQEQNQFINIVNPVRISPNTTSPGQSLAAQYQEIKKRNLSASWLLTYDALLDEGIKDSLSLMDQNQELGIFLEVSPKLASESGVVYNQADSWHRAKSVFLSGYLPEQRIKMIDQVFNQFKNVFGYYPSSVGAWWVDSFSLSYLHDEYGVSANLGLADQFSTDGYQVWGQYFGVPFYPSKYHAGMPAQDVNTKIGAVTIQWAPRDPLNGYGQGGASLYSTQDYFTLGLTNGYFASLVDLYANKHTNSFGQITIGLEADLPLTTYQGVFAKQLDLVLEREKLQQLQIVTMKQFANWYQKQFPKLSPQHLVESNDLLGKNKQAIWYQSPKYRIGLVIDRESNETRIIDWRVFASNFYEPYWQSPNEQLDLLINLPSIFDQTSDNQSFWKIGSGDVQVVADQEGLTLKFKEGLAVQLLEDQVDISNYKRAIPPLISKSALLETRRQDKSLVLIPKRLWPINYPGHTFSDLTIEASYFLNQRKVKLGLLTFSLLTLILIWLINRMSSKVILRLVLISSVMLAVSVIANRWTAQNSRIYLTSQAEVDALLKLSALPAGKVIVYDGDCLQCHWSTSYPPAVYANKRSYVAKLAHQPIVYNRSVFLATDRGHAYSELRRLRAKYLYLVKYENYAEKVPFSPGDLRIEKIYENANAQLWKVID